MQASANLDTEIPEAIAVPGAKRKAFNWSKGFELFCQRASFRSIADELQCSVQSVFMAAKRGNWRAKRQHVEERLPKNESLMYRDAVINQLITYHETELQRINKLEDALQADFDASDSAETRCKVAAALRDLAVRRMDVLGIPRAGTRRPPATEKAERRGVVQDISASVTDVMPAQS